MDQIKTCLGNTTVSTILIGSIDGEHVWFETMVFGPYGDEAVAFSQNAEDAWTAHNSICKAIACVTDETYDPERLLTFTKAEVTRKVDPYSRAISPAIRRMILGV